MMGIKVDNWKIYWYKICAIDDHYEGELKYDKQNFIFWELNLTLIQNNIS